MDIEAIYDELSAANKIDRRTQEIIQAFLDRLENGEVYMDDTVRYADYKTYKTNRIKVLLYNNQDKVTKDIALLLN
jgi:ribosome assembly protein YihI (activator of Der GTPase)